MNTREYPSEVIAKDKKTDAQAVAETTPSDNKRYFITGVSASYDHNDVYGGVQIKNGAQVIWESYINGAYQFNFNYPLKGNFGESVSAILERGDTGDILGLDVATGFINLRGYLSY